MKNLNKINLISLLTFCLSILFWFYFDRSKHIPQLLNINVFAEDPYDAISTFGMQLAFVIGSITLLRSIRIWNYNQESNSKNIYIIRGCLLTATTVSICVLTNFIAEFIYQSFSPASISWLVLNSGLLFLLILSLFIICFSFKIKSVDNFNSETNSGDDALTDFIQLTKQTIDSVSEKNKFINYFRKAGNNFLKFPSVRRINNWINPHKHLWRFSFLFAIATSLFITVTQMFLEGINSDIKIVALVFSISIIAETTMIILFFSLVNKFLNLIIKEQ